MNEILIVKKDRTVDITEMVEQIQWEGSKNKAPRKLSVNMISTTRGFHQSVPVDEGEGIMFLKDGKEMFQGILFNTGINGKARKNIDGYDLMIYTVKNKDAYLFENKKASDIMKKLCGDFGIPTGTITDTGFTIPFLLFADGRDSIFDMVMKALYLTYKHTGIRFTFFAKGGKVHLLKRSENLKKWVIESGVNLVDYEYSTSIEDTVTQVKLKSGEENKTIIASAKDDSLMKKFGILQHYESVTEKLTQQQLDERAKAILAEKGKVKKTFQLKDIIGIPDIIAGTAIHVIVPELNIKKGYYVEEDRHIFKGNDHRMDLTLTETDEIEEIDVNINTDGSKKSSSGSGSGDDFNERLRKEVLG